MWYYMQCYMDFCRNNLSNNLLFLDFLSKDSKDLLNHVMKLILWKDILFNK